VFEPFPADERTWNSGFAAYAAIVIAYLIIEAVRGAVGR
jgi:hypothetical protein